MTSYKLSLRYLLTVLLVSASGLFIYANSTFGCCGAYPEPPLNGFGDMGPYNTEMLTLNNQCEVLQPPGDTADYPVVLWAGGIDTNTASYGHGLEHIASYGFVVGSIDSNPDSLDGGEALLACLDTITTSTEVNADISQVAVAGHSVGGSSAIFAGTDSRIDTALLVQPLWEGSIGHDTTWESQQQGPVLLLLGENDMLSSLDDSEAFFYRVNTSIFAAAEGSANHFEALADFGEFAPIIAGWLRYQFYSDYEAAELFVLPERLVCAEPNFSCEINGDFE